MFFCWWLDITVKQQKRSLTVITRPILIMIRMFKECRNLYMPLIYPLNLFSMLFHVWALAVNLWRTFLSSLHVFYRTQSYKMFRRQPMCMSLSQYLGSILQISLIFSPYLKVTLILYLSISTMWVYFKNICIIHVVSTINRPLMLTMWPMSISTRILTCTWLDSHCILLKYTHQFRSS